MLRAYANRSMVLAMIFGVMALTSLGFAVYVRVQPPTVIKVDRTGEATVVGGTRPGSGFLRLGLLPSTASAESAPTDVEGRAMIRRFLENYLTYTPTTVEKQLPMPERDDSEPSAVHVGKLSGRSTVGKDKGRTTYSRFKVQSTNLWVNSLDLRRIRRQEVQDPAVDSSGLPDRIVGRYSIR
jgi:hypothetical protein